MLVHALDGYDEISLTQDTKIYSEKGEEIYSAEDLHFKTITADSIFGGSSKQEAAEIFLNILKGNATYEQNAVVLANAAMALKNTGKYGDYDSCLALSRESLERGKLLKVYNCWLRAKTLMLYIELVQVEHFDFAQCDTML